MMQPESGYSVVSDQLLLFGLRGLGVAYACL